MERKLSRLSLLNLTKLKVLLSLGFKGYLADKGWFNAYLKQAAIDDTGNCIPWLTYSFIDFIQDRLNKSHAIFEFGSGNSTIFYSKYTKQVVAVEHDLNWYNKVKTLLANNAELIYCELQSGLYAQSVINTNRKFDIIIVDGRDRVNCCKTAVNALTEEGVIILDDSERENYKEAHLFLKNQGFKHLPFTGMAPGVILSKCTSVFYKSNNCLGI